MDQLNPRNNDKIYNAYQKMLKMSQKIITEETYKEFFTKMLKKYGVDEPDKLPDDKKKQFYDEVDKKWKGKNEKPEANEAKYNCPHHNNSNPKDCPKDCPYREKMMNESLDESTGGRLHGVFGDLFDYLDNNFYGAAGSDEKGKAFKAIPKLKKETEKLYKLWQKELKGSGLLGW